MLGEFVAVPPFLLFASTLLLLGVSRRLDPRDVHYQRVVVPSGVLRLTIFSSDLIAIRLDARPREA